MSMSRRKAVAVILGSAGLAALFGATAGGVAGVVDYLLESSGRRNEKENYQSQANYQPQATVQMQYLGESYEKTKYFAETSDITPPVPATLSQLINHLYALSQTAWTNSTDPVKMRDIIQGAKQQEDNEWHLVDDALNPDKGYSWEGRSIKPMGIITNNDKDSSGFFLYDRNSASAMLDSIELKPNVDLSKLI